MFTNIVSGSMFCTLPNVQPVKHNKTVPCEHIQRQLDMCDKSVVVEENHVVLYESCLRLKQIMNVFSVVI